MLPINTILHPTDFSESAAYAARLACALARDYGARLIVLHVATPPVAYGDAATPSEPTWSRAELHEQLQQVLPEDPLVRTEHRLAEGDAVAEILRAVRTLRCDLIVMGTHGRTGLGRLLMGSVAEEVLRQATCPVLTVKSPSLQGTSGRASAAAAGSGAAATR